MFLTLTPAYGRDFKTAKTALESYNDNQDWIIDSYGHPYDGKPINKEQVTDEVISLRFDSLRKTTKVGAK